MQMMADAKEGLLGRSGIDISTERKPNGKDIINGSGKTNMDS